MAICIQWTKSQIFITELDDNLRGMQYYVLKLLESLNPFTTNVFFFFYVQ